MENREKMKVKMKYIGEIKVANESLLVSDPCYGLFDVFNQTRVDNTDKKYEVYLGIVQDGYGEWNVNSFLHLQRKGLKPKLPRGESVGYIGVDSGTMGIFDINEFNSTRDESGEKNEEWYKKNVVGMNDRNSSFTLLDNAVIAETGYGDFNNCVLVERDCNGKARRIYAVSVFPDDMGFKGTELVEVIGKK